MLSIMNLKVHVNDTIILNGVNLKIKSGETHVIMGPNGSGKSTLANTLAGRKDCIVTSGSITFKNLNLLHLEPHERSGEGVFLAFQYPIEIPGINNLFFLQSSINAIRKYRNQPVLNRVDINQFIKSKIKLLKIPVDFLDRSVNVGFSGGEKKRNDVLQMVVLEPSLCILDETDSGLDIDAIKSISLGINTLKNSDRSFIIITHYQRILEYIKPDFVHILYQGRIIKSGDISLVQQLEEKGYGWITQ